MIERLLSNPNAIFWICVMSIPIAAILIGGVTSVMAQVIKHRERMAMIERGMHPDTPRPPRETIRQQ